MKKETLGAHLRNLLTPYKNLLQLVKDGKADEETIRKHNLDNLDELIAFSNSEEMEQEPASEDLENAAIDYDNQGCVLYAEDEEGDIVEISNVRYAAFKSGAQWQKERDESRRRANIILANTDVPKDPEIEVAFEDIWGDVEKDVPNVGNLPENQKHRLKVAHHDTFEAGALWQKKQMMKGAVEGQVERGYCEDKQ